MRLKPKTYIYIFYSLLAGVLLSLIFINSMFFAQEARSATSRQITSPSGPDLVDQLLPDRSFMQRSQ